MPYNLILWLCLASAPDCTVDNSVVKVGPTPAATLLDCQEIAAFSETIVPTPSGYVRHFLCQGGTPI